MRIARSATLLHKTLARSLTHPLPRTRRLFSCSVNRLGSPVILCGATERIGAGVVELLKPEYDVVQFVMSASTGAAQIPHLLRAQAPPSSDSELGTHDYSQKPIAVILGGAFTDEDTDEMMSTSRGIHPVPWLRVNKSIAAPPLGPEYAKALVKRIKEKLGSMSEEGLKKEKVVWY